MHSLWVDPEDRQFPRLEADIEVDVAIIGGGLAGIGAASALHGECTAVLLEARTLASGASGRNAGFVLAGPAMPFDAAAAAVGREEAETIWRFSLDNNRYIADAIERHEIDCGYLRRGSMSLAASEDEWQELRSCARMLHESGIECCVVEQGDIPRPFHRYYLGGLYYPGNAEMNPAAFVRGLAAALRDRVAIYENSAVRALRCEERWTLETERGRVVASRVIVATNAYTAALLPSVPIAPRRGQVLATAPLPAVIVPFPMYADRGFWYWRQTADARLVVGGARNMDLSGEVGTEERLHAAIQAALEQSAARFTAGLVPIETRWAGIMGFTPDVFPIAGELPGNEGLYIAAGFSGHGVSLAPRCGMEVAKMALGRAARLPGAFNPMRDLVATRVQFPQQ
jgi:glycine/D-amino acid oxidase-like deaminating enzyme